MAVFVVGVILVVTLLFYFLYYKPRLACKNYVKQLTKLGYRVYELPFKPFALPFYESLERYERQKKDPLYASKHLYQGYDVLVTNVMIYPSLLFLNLKLGQQVVSADKVMIYPKIGFLLKLLIYAFGYSITFLEKDQWKNRRKLLSKAFNFEFIKGMIPLISRIFNQTLDRFELQSLEGKQKNEDKLIQGEIDKIGSKMFALVVLVGFLGMGSINQTIEDISIERYSFDVAQSGAKISRDPLILLLGVWFFKLGLKKQYKIFSGKVKKLNQFFQTQLNAIRHQFEGMSPEEQKKNNTKNLVISMLYHAKTQGVEKEFTDNALVEEILNFFIAGSETTSHVFTMMILYIFQHPHVEAKLRQQIKLHFKSQQDFNYENLKKMEYLDWVQLETLRLQGPAELLIERISTENSQIADIQIHKSTCINYMHKPNLYDDNIFEEAHKFKPQRWAQENKDLENMVSMAFSGGPRGCIGKNLALLELKIAVIKFLQRYEGLKEDRKREFIFTFAYRIKNSGATFRKVK